MTLQKSQSTRAQWMEQDLELTTPSEACPSEFNPPSLVADQVKEFEHLLSSKSWLDSSSDSDSDNGSSSSEVDLEMLVD
jgi:hypothetical protein